VAKPKKPKKPASPSPYWPTVKGADSIPLPDDPTLTFHEARAFLNSLNVRYLGGASFDQIAKTMDLSEFAKAWSFAVAYTTSATAVIEIREGLKAAIAEGLTLAEFKAQFAAHFGPRSSAAHIETVFRTNLQRAYGQGQLVWYRAVADEFDVWEYQAIDDTRVRPAHLAFDGRMIPAADPFWQTYFPPWAFNCRCSIRPLRSADLPPEKITTGDKATVQAMQSITAGLPPDKALKAIETLRPSIAGPGQTLTAEEWLSTVKLPVDWAAQAAQALGSFLTDPDLIAAVDAAEDVVDAAKVKKAVATAKNRMGVEDPFAIDTPLEDFGSIDFANNHRRGWGFASDGDSVENFNLQVQLRYDGRTGVRYYEFSGRLTQNAQNDMVRYMEDQGWRREQFRQTHGLLREEADGAIAFPGEYDATSSGSARGMLRPIDATRSAKLQVSDKTWGVHARTAETYCPAGNEPLGAIGDFRITIPKGANAADDYAALRAAVEGTPLEKILAAPTQDDYDRFRIIREYCTRNPTRQVPPSWHSMNIATLRKKADELVPAWRKVTVEWDPQLRRYVPLRPRDWDTALRERAMGFYGVGSKTNGQTVASMIEQENFLPSKEVSRRGFGHLNPEDLSTGGNDSMFTRIFDKGVHGGRGMTFHAAGGRWNFEIDPVVFDAIDTYAFNGDHYGNASAAYMKSRLALDELFGTKNLANLAGSNEAMIRRGIPLRHIRRCFARDYAAKAELIAELAKRGITHVNGQAVEKWIEIRTTLPSF
jgi:SPP1 gp7 family putative phage head morphogenesis protein